MRSPSLLHALPAKAGNDPTRQHFVLGFAQLQNGGEPVFEGDSGIGLRRLRSFAPLSRVPRVLRAARLLSPSSPFSGPLFQHLASSPRRELGLPRMNMASEPAWDSLALEQNGGPLASMPGQRAKEEVGDFRKSRGGTPGPAYLFTSW